MNFGTEEKLGLLVDVSSFSSVPKFLHTFYVRAQWLSVALCIIYGDC